MKTMHTFKITLCALTCGGALLNPSVSSAINVDYHIDVTTSPLIGNPAGPFSLDFQLNDGSGTGDGNNTATISGFNFSGGAPMGTPTLFGGAAGNLGTAVTLTDNNPFNEFFQGFTPGGSLGFDVLLSLNADAGVTPDEFSFAILDKSLANIATTGTGDSLFNVQISSVPITQVGASTAIAGVGAAEQTVPEAASGATLVMAALGLAGASLRLRTRTDRA